MENNIKQRDFEDLYRQYYPKLVRFSKEYVLTLGDAENVVQDVFLYCWEKRDTLHTVENMNAFLFRLVKNKCIDFLRHTITVEEKNKDLQDIQRKEYELRLQSIEQFDDKLFDDNNLELIIRKAIDNLPEKCREIFILSKIEGLKYEEISERMNLSPNTVRNQVAIAMKKMKDQLKDLYPLLFLFLNY